MFSKKSLHITLAFVLLIGLAAVGIAYGAWTDQLNIGGTAVTGNLGVQFVSGAPGQAWADDLDGATAATGGADCTVALSNNNRDLTITITNAYPGYRCDIYSGVKNTGTVPVKVKALEAVTPVAAPFESLIISDPIGSTIDPGEAYMNALNLRIGVPMSADNGTMNTGISFTYRIVAEQATTVNFSVND